MSRSYVKLKYFLNLIIFIVITIVITIILNLLGVPPIVLFIGLIILFVLSINSYVSTIRDVSKAKGKKLELTLKKIIPILLFLVISVPLGILMFVLEANQLLLMIGLVALLIFISVIFSWGIKIELKES